MAKKVKPNNYLKLGMILLGIAIFTVLAANIYKNIQDNKINNSYLGKYIASITYQEINNAKLEFSGDIFLIISQTGEKSIYNLEVKLKKLIDTYDLNDQAILIDMTGNNLGALNETLELDAPGISRLPAIVYYKDNKLITVIDSNEQLLTSGDFLHLLEQYEIVKSY